MELELRSVERQGAHEAVGAPPYLVGPLDFHRPQLQLYICFRGQKNQGESFIVFYDTEPPPSPNLYWEG